MACASPNASASRPAAQHRKAAWAALLLTALLTPARSACADEPTQPLPSPPSASSADVKNQCADAYEATQRERAAGHLLAARQAGIFCAQPSCPEVLRTDCAKWAGEVSSRVPSLLVEARTSTDLLLNEAAVQIDGAPFSDRFDGRSRELDPGRHHFQVSAPGYVDQAGDFVVVEGQQSQRLRVVLEPTPVAPPEPRTRRVPAGAFVLGGVGVLGLAGFTTFGLLGNHRKGQLSGCEPDCSRNLRGPIERDYLIADISLGASLVSFGVAAWLALASQQPPSGARKSSENDAAFAVRASADGVLLGYQRGF